MISLCFQWLLTYLLHSSVLLGCAALLDWRRLLPEHVAGAECAMVLHVAKDRERIVHEQSGTQLPQ